MQRCPVKVKWHKVRSHTGVKWNDIADELAKQGAEMA
jgi:ribonuclease HI